MIKARQTQKNWWKRLRCCFQDTGKIFFFQTPSSKYLNHLFKVVRCFRTDCHTCVIPAALKYIWHPRSSEWMNRYGIYKVCISLCLHLCSVQTQRPGSSHEIESQEIELKDGVQQQTMPAVISASHLCLEACSSSWCRTQTFLFYFRSAQYTQQKLLEHLYHSQILKRPAICLIVLIFYYCCMV